MEKKKNNLIFIIVVLILCAIIASIYFYDRNKTKNFINEFKTYENKEAKNSNNTDKKDSSTTLYCVGDSTTLGVANQNNSYPKYLDKSANFKIKTIGDEKITSSALLVKLGVTPTYVEKLTIPASSSPTPITLSNQNGSANNELLNCQGTIDSVTINGITGKIIYQDNKLLFTREHPGERTVINSATLVQVNNNIEPDSILILYTGAYENSINGSLVNNQKEIIRAFNTDNYIVVSLTQNDRNETNQSLKDAYGDHYLDFKSYLLANGLQDAKISPTPEDLQNVKENKTPDSLLSDEINGNDKYCQLLSKEIIKKLSILKYIKNS